MDVAWIEKALENTPYDLYQAFIRNEGNQPVLVIEIEKQGYINLDDCDTAARILLEVIPESLDVLLEVGSAGAEREISTLKQFQNALGKTVKIQTFEQRLEGTIEAVKDDVITISYQKKTTQISLMDIQKANLTIGL